ncbi:MAG: pentapeptide repeat-containing protein, partial [Isosphaeraceae bacterium]
MSWTALGAADLPDPRAFAPEELNAILAAHTEWLDSEGHRGARADLRRGLLRGLDLSRADLRRAWLREATLREANLQGARLAGADLTGADLTHANLTGAALRGADLRDADLAGTALRDADLQDADLRDVRGMTGGQIGGSDVAGAKLPDAIVKFEGLSNVQETSKGAQGLFTSILLLCGYTWLTVIATRDAQLFNRAAPISSRLPILGTEIPLAQLYTVMPLLLLGFYLYFLLYLQRLWEELTDLPAVFPDGRPLDRKAYPWLLNGLVCIYFSRLSDYRSPLAKWQARTSAGVAWGLVPTTLLLIWGRYLRSHNWWVTAIHVVIVGMAIGAGVGFYRLAVNTLRAGRPSRLIQPKRWGRLMMNTKAFTTAVALVVSTVLFALSAGAIHGVNSRLLKSGVSVTRDRK